MLAVFRTLAAWGLTATGLPWIVALHFLGRRGLIPDEVVIGVIRAWGRATLACLGVRLSARNPSTLEDQVARVVVINHQSALDVLWAAAFCAPAPFAIGKKEVVWVPGLNLIWWAFDFIRIDRKNTQAAIRAMAGVAEKIRRERRTLYIAPEGTRTSTGQMLPFKKGAFHIAIQGQLPIYPVVVSGAYEALPKSRFIGYPGEIRVKFLEPVSTIGLGAGDVDALLARVRAEMEREFRSL